MKRWCGNSPDPAVVDADAFAQEWLAGWNSHDLERILSHYTDDVVFRSQKAVPLVGCGRLEGKAALRAYWDKALRRQPDLHFTVESVFDGHGMMVILYRNQIGRRAVETLYFDGDGFVFRAAACHADEFA
ncbi:MAG: nuclear transport factor 2 family protein [Marinibacterium sp.]